MMCYVRQRRSSGHFRIFKLLFLSGLMVPAALQAATIHFNDETTGGYGFSAKAGGFKNNALGNFVKVGHKSFELDSVTKNGHDIPKTTTIALQNADHDRVPTNQAYPAGTFGWSYDGGGLENPTYTFTLFAGGKFWFEGEQCYVLSFSVDNGKSYSVATNPHTDKNPKLVNRVLFRDSSTVVITLRTQNPCAQHNETHGPEPLLHEYADDVDGSEHDEF